jgi:hypothetical protein
MNLFEEWDDGAYIETVSKRCSFPKAPIIS